MKTYLGNVKRADFWTKIKHASTEVDARGLLSRRESAPNRWAP